MSRKRHHEYKITRSGVPQETPQRNQLQLLPPQTTPPTFPSQARPTMLLEDSPSALLRATLTNFSTPPDRAAVSRINDSLSTLNQSRSLRINHAETALRRLSRQLATVSSQHRDTLSGHDSHDHAREIVELDTKKFRVAKKAQELEVEGERLEAELERLRRRLEELEAEGVEGGGSVRREREGDDPTVYDFHRSFRFIRLLTSALD